MLGSASRRTSGVLLATIALTLAACERPTVPPPQLDPGEVVVSANVSQTSIASMVIKVTATDIVTPLVFNMKIENGLATGNVAIPAGSARRLELEAFDANQIKTHRGEKTIDVKPGPNNGLLSVMLLPIAGDQPVEATFGQYKVSVSPTSISLPVGGSQQFTVTITDNATIPNSITPLAGEVKWATNMPAFFEITVDSPTKASVKALPGAAGKVADIVATFNGFAAVATVTVQQ